MHFLKTLFLGPVLGFAIVVRILPYLAVGALGHAGFQALDLGEETRGALAQVGNAIPSRAEPLTAESVVGVIGLMAALYLSLLILHRINREAARQAGLVSSGGIEDYLVPGIRGRFRIAMAAFFLGGVWLIFGALERKGADMPTAISVLMLILFAWFPVFGVRGITRAAGLGTGPRLGTGALTLAICAWIFAWLGVFFALLLSLALGGALTVTEQLAAVLIFAWCSLAAASAMILSRHVDRALQDREAMGVRARAAPVSAGEMLRARMAER